MIKRRFVPAAVQDVGLQVSTWNTAPAHNSNGVMCRHKRCKINANPNPAKNSAPLLPVRTFPKTSEMAFSCG